jgi:trimeric autotransporter adhesin
MAQHDYNIANQGFPAFRSDLNNALSAIQTTNSGTSRPSGAVAGQLWLDTTSATTPTLKYYDGADDISLATIDHTANTVNWLDSTVSITGLSTTATGTVLTLSDTATTSTVNLIIDNDKEIRFREATANGTNYVALSAPASLSADLTFTLPATDGTNGQVLQTNGSGVLSFATPASGLAWQSIS